LSSITTLLEPVPRSPIENLLARARMLAPKLRERSYTTNKTGRIPDETIKDFWDYHLNYLLRPKKFGGPAATRYKSLSFSPTVALAGEARLELPGPRGFGR
jgi:hypothetical protein